MCRKTIVKKACSAHFRDIFQNIENMDNEQYDLDKVVIADSKENEELERLYEELEGITDLEVLRTFYKDNAGK